MSPFGGWHDRYHEDIFCPAISKAGLEARRADDPFRSSSIVGDIWHMIVAARVMLADLTGKNPNVFYELGLAHAARKPALLLSQDIEDVPFDLRSLRVIVYDVNHPHWGEKLTQDIVSGLQETLESPKEFVLPAFLLEAPSGGVSVSPEERPMLEIQRQIDVLRAEVQTQRFTSRDPARRASLGPTEARRRVKEMFDEGTSEEEIIRTVSRLGPPPSWVRKRFAELAENGGHYPSSASNSLTQTTDAAADVP